jgi:predicted unusual protein kinase regulating ubiquinone biosynthesis (AarF/ABC1/UbiB family)
MSDIPRRAVTRTAKMAALPVAFAGRTAWGLGKRLGGRPAERVAAEVQARTAEQVFRVLGELKGGAMKFGQALSVLESALPEQLAGPYRATLTKLQEAAPPLPAATVHAVLADSLGADWRALFREFDDRAAAAASIGQVHRAVWHDGRAVAVKVQYPGAAEALLADLTTIGRLSSVLGPLMPAIDLKSLILELRDRLAEEVDYRLEGEWQRRFAEAFAGDAEIVVPPVVHVSDRVLVSEWLDGTPLSVILDSGTEEERDRAGRLYLHFLFAGPARARLLHADPHPGNYRLAPDGRLGVLDFGAVAVLPDGLPPAIGRLMRIALEGDAVQVRDGLRAEGFLRPGVDVDAADLLAYLGPFAEPVRTERFTFRRDWMREQFTRVSSPQGGIGIGMKLNMPPGYLLIHRVWLGGIGVLCQLGADVAVRTELERSLPGFAEEGSDAGPE